MKKSVKVTTPIPTLEEYRIALGMTKKRAKEILKMVDKIKKK